MPRSAISARPQIALGGFTTAISVHSGAEKPSVGWRRASSGGRAPERTGRGFPVMPPESLQGFSRDAPEERVGALGSTDIPRRAIRPGDERARGKPREECTQAWDGHHQKEGPTSIIEDRSTRPARDPREEGARRPPVTLGGRPTFSRAANATSAKTSILGRRSGGKPPPMRPQRFNNRRRPPA